MQYALQNAYHGTYYVGLLSTLHSVQTPESRQTNSITYLLQSVDNEIHDNSWEIVDKSVKLKFQVLGILTSQSRCYDRLLKRSTDFTRVSVLTT